MIVQVLYGERPLTRGVESGYAFDAPADVRVGDHLFDGLQVVTVIGLGRQGYDGPVRTLATEPVRHGGSWVEEVRSA